MKFEEFKSSIKGRYRNGRDQIGRDLVGPCIEHATLYRRGTGFFSSSAMLAYVGALDNLIHDRLKIQILCSPVVHDRVVLESIRFNKDNIARLKTLQKFADNIVLIAAGFRSETADTGRRYRQQLLSYLIAKGTIEIKFALPRNFTDSDFQELVKISEQAKNLEESEEVELGQTELPKNLYHVKNGYFLFQNGEQVVFDGSFNESISGHRGHIDSTNVWRSWIPEDKERLNSLRAEIDEDFDEISSYFKVVPLGEEALRLITEGSPAERPRKPDHREKPTPAPARAGDLRAYQKDAFGAWKSNGYCGIIALATGTGKTKTAIAAIKGFRETAGCGLVLVTVPYLTLANQWLKELYKEDITTISVFDSHENWLESATEYFYSHKDQRNISKQTPVFVCVNKSFRGEEFQSLLKLLEGTEGNRLLVADECHHFNSNRAMRSLPKSFSLRMGLSATPYESDEKQHLESYFGPIVYEYSIGQAIKNEYLCPYNYYPILIEFSKEELREVIGISKRLDGDRESDPDDDHISGGNISDYEKLDQALEMAASKLLALEQTIESMDPASRSFSLFYCGKGSVTLPDGTEIRQITTVTKLLYRLGWTVSNVTYKETQKERKLALESFKEGHIQALASIRVLDEGIDIPDCRNAFILASQRSERQGIQRRGRVLRTSARKSYANLYDFIIIGPRTDDRFTEELYEKELRRARLFSEDALNSEYCKKLLSNF